MSDFAKAFVALMANEGGLSDVSSDPGNWTGGQIGAGSLIGTHWGLSAPVLVRHGVTTAEGVAAGTQDQAMQIARAEYWDAYQCDALPQGIAFEVLDAAYNGGHPGKWLQAALGIAVDGQVGPLTVAAANAADGDKVVMRFVASRLEYMTTCANWATAGKGWARRIAANLRRAAT